MTGSTTTQAGGRNSASLPSYSDVAAQLGLSLCAGGSECPWYGTDHQRGLSVGKTIHWRDRRPTRRGLRRLLKLAAVTLLPDARRGERFVQLYWQNIEADRLAEEIGIRFPRSLADPDRAKVRFWLAKFRNDPLDREFREQRTLMRRIRRWARA